jgi:phage/plasmid-like protein (TIGR03299 family)
MFQSGLFFGQNAWHGLGTTLPDDSPVRYSIDDAIRIAGLDWTVETVPLHIAAKDGGFAPVSTHFAIRRSDTNDILGVVGDRYNPLQNRDQFDFFKPFLDSGECAFETCGALKGGAIVWVLAKVNRPDATIVADDKISKYLLLSSSHDGSMATSVGFCPIRVVCWNTLSAGLRSEKSTLLKVKHTAQQRATLATIRETINLVNESFEATAAQYRKLAQCGISDSDLRRYVRLVLELPENDDAIKTRSANIMDGIIELCRTGIGNDGQTVWSAYNGVTEYITHHRGRNAETRLQGAFYGEGRALNDRALSLALQLAS